MQAISDRIHAFLDRRLNCTNALFKVLVRLFASERSLKCTLQLESEDHEEFDDLNYRLDGDLGKERRSQTTIKPLQEQLLYDRSNVDTFRQLLTLYIERFTADVTDGFSGFLNSFSSKV